MPDGFINVLKPSYMTSSDVVVKVRGIIRRFYGEKIKVGHLGTLDPGGAGVLPVAVGKGTRLFSYSDDSVKIYRAGFKFGVETDTLDSFGKVTKTCDKVPTIDEILAVLPSFIGKIAQLPPNFSSISVNGKRAYDLAREGKDFTLSERLIEIFDIKLLYEEDGNFVFEIVCSSGTYIRSIVRDLAKSLSTVGFMSFIIRLKSGKFDIFEAVTLDEINENPEKYILPVGFFLSDYKRFNVPAPLCEKVKNGVKVKLNNLPDGYFTVYVEGQLLGIGTSENGCLSVKTRLL